MENTDNPRVRIQVYDPDRERWREVPDVWPEDLPIPPTGSQVTLESNSGYWIVEHVAFDIRSGYDGGVRLFLRRFTRDDEFAPPARSE